MDITLRWLNDCNIQTMHDKLKDESWRMNVCGRMKINYFRKDQPNLVHTSVQRLFDAREAEYKSKVWS